jgi:hypothetical protein
MAEFYVYFYFELMKQGKISLMFSSIIKKIDEESEIKVGFF